jgi:hypothetical protein
VTISALYKPVLITSALIAGLFLVPHVYAAPLNFTTAENISLSSPSTTLTIATGSVADALTVNATSVAVTLSATTGGSFALLSPSYDLAVATSSGDGTISIACSNGIDTATLSQSTGSTVYTVTPGGTNCANASPPILSNIVAANITTNTATITWTTNVPADSTVSYGTTSSYGATSTDANHVTSHSIPLSSLAASTLYHYAVSSAAYGTSTTSGDNTFTTTAISSGGGGGGGGGSAYIISIDGGSPSIATANVTLSLYGTLAYTMEMSNTPDFASSTWIPYATTYPWILTSDLGTKTVYARFRTVAGEDLGMVSTSIELTSVTKTSTSTDALKAQIAALQAQLQSLITQLNQRNGNEGGGSVAPYAFTRNLSLWNTGADVQALQKILIAEDAGPAARALATHGTTKTFGSLTFNALKEFQRHVGISATGYFGPMTRAYVARL